MPFELDDAKTQECGKCGWKGNRMSCLVEHHRSNNASGIFSAFSRGGQESIKYCCPKCENIIDEKIFKKE
jgi:hypothetical protein